MEMLFCAVSLVLVAAPAGTEPTVNSRLALHLFFPSLLSESLDIDRSYGAYSVAPTVRITASKVPLTARMRINAGRFEEFPADTESTFTTAVCARARASRLSMKET